MYKLTIGIPTYNGSETISASIESALNQIGLLECGTVELLVCDNFSEDNTWKILNSYREKHPNDIRIYRNDSNVGYDRNVDRLFRLAHGEFVWPLGDDDIVTPGSIQKVLNVIEKNEELGLLFVGGVIGHQDNAEAKICTNGSQFLLLTNFRSGGMSANIIHRSLWLNCNVSRYLDTQWVHFGMVIEAAALANSYVFMEPLIDEPVLLPKKWGAGGGFLLFGIELEKIFRRLPELGYTEKCIKKASYIVRGNYPRSIIKAKALGLIIDMNIVRQFFLLYFKYPYFWSIYLPCLLMPALFSRLLYHRFKVSRNMSKL